MLQGSHRQAHDAVGLRDRRLSDENRHGATMLDDVAECHARRRKIMPKSGRVVKTRGVRP